jgi:parvulin-like peptidyl-prolyl isomerase
MWPDTKSYFLTLLSLLAMTVQAQESRRHCEFAAVVNNHVITEVAYLAALNDYKAELSRQMHQQGKTNAEIGAEFERTKLGVLNALIDDLLLDQKAEELGLAEDADIKKIIENPSLVILPGYRDDFGSVAFEKALMHEGIHPEQLRNSVREQILRHTVIHKEVLAPIFEGITDGDRRDYYDEHKEDFMLPAEVTLSEIFVPFDGYPESEVERRASKILAELRAGADFIEAVKGNTPASHPSYAAEGHLGSFALLDLKASVAMAVSGLSPGEYAEPIRLSDGYMIIRLDARLPSTLRRYDDPTVQEALSRAVTLSRSEEARKNYIAGLRNNARIEICSGR